LDVTSTPVEWLAGGTFALLLDAAATNGQLGVGRFRVSQGEAPPYHKHLREDEVFMLIAGTALLWFDDEEPDRDAMAKAKAADDFGQVVVRPPR
jgi:uncharacterized cupin superfamily protein